MSNSECRRSAFYLLCIQQMFVFYDEEEFRVLADGKSRRLSQCNDMRFTRASETSLTCDVVFQNTSNKMSANSRHLIFIAQYLYCFL